MDPKTIVTWLTLASAIATGTARVIALEERQANQLEKIGKLGEALNDVRGYLTAAETRIEALEKDRQLLERIHALDVRLARIEEHRR
jgi:hypothetical protein